MRVLIIGSGGREHAMVWKLRQSAQVKEIFVAPGNGGIAIEDVTVVPIAVDAVSELVTFARKENIQLVIPGPELPLTLGITDAMNEAGIPCFGPTKYCAQLEGSKTFAKAVMEAGKVPTAETCTFTDYADARAYIEEKGAPLVVKADGLAAGKGVVVAHTLQEALDALDDIMLQKSFGAAGNTVVIEECLIGEEASFLCFCDGVNALPLPSAQDHKAVFDGDKGPNTGGMGAYSPAPVLPIESLESMTDLVIRPILRVMAERGHPFKGILYAGLMMTAQGPKVLEYNVRFGDPECQPLLMRLNDDLAAIMLDCINGTLAQGSLNYSHKSAVGVVIAAEGYPGAYHKGMTIEGVGDADALPFTKVFHSGTVLEKGILRASGGRILCVTALGDTLQEAQQQAYAAVKKIRMEHSQYRSDIGDKGLAHMNAVYTEQKNFRPSVAIFIGSSSDEKTISPCAEVLRTLGIPYVFTVTSAHRTPERTEALVRDLESQGVQVFICAAGMAAHLAGAVAARSVKPVIGIPVSGSSLGGMDALLATVQMPPGFPVGTVALDKAGARNAAWLAAQILALQDQDLEERILAARNVSKADVAKAGEELMHRHMQDG